MVSPVSNDTEMLKILLELKASIDKIFRDYMSRVPSEEMPELDVSYDPPIDIIDTGEELILIMDVPGFSKDEIRIKATEEMLEIKAISNSRRTKGRYLVKQRLNDCNIVKRVKLPMRIKPHEVKAVLRSGLLEIHMPKAEVMKEIEVMVA